MPKLTVLFGPQGSGNTTLAEKLAGKRRTYRTDFHQSGDPLRISHVLLHRPEVVIVDGCPLREVDGLVTISKGKVLRIRHSVTGMHEIETPELIVVIQNSVPAQQVIEWASGRDIDLIDCSKLKEVHHG